MTTFTDLATKYPSRPSNNHENTIELSFLEGMPQIRSLQDILDLLKWNWLDLTLFLVQHGAFGPNQHITCQSIDTTQDTQ